MPRTSMRVSGRVSMIPGRSSTGDPRAARGNDGNHAQGSMQSYSASCDWNQISTSSSSYLLGGAFVLSFGLACTGMFFFHLLGVHTWGLAVETNKSRSVSSNLYNRADTSLPQVAKQLAGPLQFSPERLNEINKYLKTDTDNYDPHLTASALEMLQSLWQHCVIGLLSVDHSSTSLQADEIPDNRSFAYRVKRVTVEGLTIEAVQRGLSVTGEFPPSEFRVKFANGTTDAVGREQWNAIKNRSRYERMQSRPYNGYFDEQDYAHGIVYRYEPVVLRDNVARAVRSLEALGAQAISGDHGFLMYFQDHIANISHVPVGMSAVLQLSMIKYHLAGNANRKILLLTANSGAFDTATMIPPSVMDPSEVKQHVVVLGLQHTLFETWLDGTFAASNLRRHAQGGGSIEAVIPTVIDEVNAEIVQLRAQGAEVVAILCESTSLPSVSNAMRYHLKLPVYDAWTLFNFLAAGTKVGLYSAFIA